MKVYRIAKRQYIKNLSGVGAKKYGGRWNRKGSSVLYTSENVSLAALEMLVHVELQNLPKNLQILVLKISDEVSIRHIDIKDLPKNWRDYPAPGKLAEIGTAWLEKKESLILKVPSVVIAQERNVLINPNHPEFENVKIDKISDFEFDDRFSI